ncbi:MAG TPA: hypothetical protein PK413_12355 [Thermoanaerobaculia bacterium]|nr:hypothetical protein [Thermoanaerobaculia bacterium]
MKRTVLASILALCFATVAAAGVPTAQPATTAPADSLDLSALETPAPDASLLTPAPVVVSCLSQCAAVRTACVAACGTDVNCKDRCLLQYEGCTCNACHFCR